MTNVLEDSADLVTTSLLPQQQILYRAHRTLLAILRPVRKVVPRAGVSIQHRWSLDRLLAVFLPTAFAFERVVRIAPCVLPVLE